MLLLVWELKSNLERAKNISIRRLWVTAVLYVPVYVCVMFFCSTPPPFKWEICMFRCRMSKIAKAAGVFAKYWEHLWLYCMFQCWGPSTSLYSGPVVLQSQIWARHSCAWRHLAWLCILYNFGVHAYNKVLLFVFAWNLENHNMRLTIWDGGNCRFLTPGLTPLSAFNFTIFSPVLKPLKHGSMAAEGCSWKQWASAGRLNTMF